MIVVIPAYEPDEKLLRLVDELKQQTDYKIIIVDDGSKNAESKDVFSKLEADSAVTVLHHKVNRGKGRAMKTAFEYIKDAGFSDDGVITVDADGQHLIKDIVAVSETWAKNPNALVLGSRRFSGKVPLRSRFGNGVTRGVFAISTGVRVYDTQTGLRAFSTEKLDDMLKIGGERYEYEINQLLTCTKTHVPIIEHTIETVYLNKNETSHFNTVKDSWRIYKTIFTFVFSSFVSWAADYILLLVFNAILGGITGGAAVRLLSFNLPPLPLPRLLRVLCCQNNQVPFSGLPPKFFALVGARTISSLLNYFLNQRLVFQTKSKGSVLRYYILVAALFVLNYGLLQLMGKIGIALWLAQIIAQLVIYPLSFVIQRKFVFCEKNTAA